MSRLDLFIDKNYEKIKRHYFKQAKELGYSKRQYHDYFEDCKCFTFCGTMLDLMNEIKDKNDFYVIASNKDLVIAELFNGNIYCFI